MRLALAAILFFCFSFHSSAQDCSVTSETFSYGQRFFSSRLTLRSDSTFYLRNRGCTNSVLTMGCWKRQQDSIVLNYTQKIPVTISTCPFKPGENDSIVKFFVRDVKGNILTDYALFFCQKGHSEDGFETDSNGMVEVKRNIYEAFYTETDEENTIEDGEYADWNKMKRSLSPKAKEVFIILYPLSAPLQNNTGLQKRSFYYKDGETLVTRIGEYKKRNPR